MLFKVAPTCQEGLPLWRLQLGLRAGQQRGEDGAKVGVNRLPRVAHGLLLLFVQFINHLGTGGGDAQGAFKMVAFIPSQPLEVGRGMLREQNNRSHLETGGKGMFKGQQI